MGFPAHSHYARAMPGRVIIAAAAASLLSGAAFAQSAPDPAPIDLTTKGAAAQCPKAASGEVVVCGERERSPYRLDPTVLAEVRAKEAADNPARVQDRSGKVESCGTGTNLCSGGAIPLLGPALRVATAIVKAASGEDWREAFRNGPSDYERYQDAAESAKAKKKGRISVGIVAGN